MIPSFLLAKLYVKGSLQNSEDGFEFRLKNFNDSTLLTGIGPISVGEKHYVGTAVRMTAGEKTVSGAELSWQNPPPVSMWVQIRVWVTGEPLPAGEQRVTVAATTSDIGTIKFDLNDTVQ